MLWFSGFFQLVQGTPVILHARSKHKEFDILHIKTIPRIP